MSEPSLKPPLLCPHGVPGGCGADVEGAPVDGEAPAGPLDGVKAALAEVVDEDGVKVGPVSVGVDTDFASEGSVVVSGKF